MNAIHNDSPEVRNIVATAFPEYRGRRFAVEAFQGPMRLSSYWSGGSRDYFAFVNMGVAGLATQVPENGTPFTPAINNELTTLPTNIALVRYHRGPHEYVTVFVPAENLNRFALPAAVPLEWAEQVVLAATATYKNSYGGLTNCRFREATRATGIDENQWNLAKATLMAKKLLNAAGAITDAGRNAVGDTRLSSLASCKPS